MSAENQAAGKPDTISHFRLLEIVGSGGMGTVYRAIDERTGVVVALKLMHPHLEADQAYLERFRREAHVASLLRSPYTVQLQEFGQHGPRHFLVSEFVEGPSLGEILKSGPIEPIAAIAIAVQVALSLDEAESRGIVHRDIKPENILLAPDACVKVTDFGIARMTFASGVTTPGMFVGTLAYSAPEQHSGQTDARSDIYSLGVVLFEMLAGECPFSAPTPTGLIRLHEEAPPPLQKLTGAPPELVAVVAKCLEKDPAARYQHAAELAGALDAVRQRLGKRTAEAWMSEATGSLVAARAALNDGSAQAIPGEAGQPSAGIGDSVSGETQLSAGEVPAVATRIGAAYPPSPPSFQQPLAAVSPPSSQQQPAPVAPPLPLRGGPFQRVPLPLLIVGSMLLAALVATGAVFAAMRVVDSSGSSDGVSRSGFPGGNGSPGAESAESPLAGKTPTMGASTASPASSPAAQGTTTPAPAPTKQPVGTGPTAVPPTATPIPSTPTPVPPTPTPTDSGYPARSVATGNWDNAFTVVSNTCGAGPAVGEVWYYTYTFEELGSAKGYILDGESVDISDQDGYYLGEATLYWPRITLTWATLDGGKATLAMVFNSATHGAADHTLEYAAYGCAIRSSDR